MESFIVDKKKLPDNWPTHLLPPAFWEELGRTVATFGFLEDILKRTHFALTATRKYENITEVVYQKWAKNLELSLTDSLGTLINRIEKAFKNDDRVSREHRIAIVHRLRELSVYRNALCHGAWVSGVEADDSARLRFFRKTKTDSPKEFDRLLSLKNLTQIRNETVDITTLFMSTVTSMGVQFPGSTSPGAVLFETQ